MTNKGTSCLSFPNDEERLRVYDVNFSQQEENLKADFDALRQMQSVKQIKVSLLHGVHGNQRLFQLALAIRSNPRVSEVIFCSCTIDDIGPICLAVSEKVELASIEFHGCRVSRHAGETLRIFLHSNAIGRLVLNECHFMDGTTSNTISAGLHENRSLRQFEFTCHLAILGLHDGLQKMLSCNQKLEELALELHDTSQVQSLARAVEPLQRLNKLTLCNSLINIESMEAIIFLSFAVKSLETLDLNQSTIDQKALKLLVRMLSNNQIINSLSLGYIRVGPTNAPLDYSCGNMKVKRLDLSGLQLDEPSFSQMVDDVADNPSLKFFDLTFLLNSNERAEKFCDVFLRQNRSPTELYVSDIGPYATLITEALQQNSSLSSLTIVDLKAGLTTFAQGLASMNGLRNLTIGERGLDEEYTLEFFQSLQQSMEQNCSLSKLSICCIDSDDDRVKRFLPMIQYYLVINRVGRHSLMAARVPVGIWAYILARSSHEVDGIFFVLTGKPEIVTPSRKRKDRD